jgi:chromosome segregation ATPase
LEQLHILRQEAEIQREDLRSAEAETKKAWKIVENANSKSSEQAKYLKEAQDAKIQLSGKVAGLQRSMDELGASTKLSSVEKNRLETEITILQRRVKTEQESRQRAEAEVVAKNRELGFVKLQDTQASRSKVASLSDQRDKLEIALKDWQTRHADLAARLDISETHKSRAVLEIEDLVCWLSNLLNTES